MLKKNEPTEKTIFKGLSVSCNMLFTLRFSFTILLLKDGIDVLNTGTTWCHFLLFRIDNN